MDHLSDIQLLEHAAGPADPAAQAHLVTCPACAQRLQALAATWSALGAWPTPPAPDLAPRILDTLPNQRTTSRFFAKPMRIAAALLISAALGHAAGRLTWRPAATPPDDAVAASALHLDDLANSSATGLLASLNAPSAVEGGQP